MEMLGKSAALILGLIAAASVGAQSNDEKIAQAVQPLPEDLRAGAGVFEYNEAGERAVLREASNQVECQPLDEDGFTTCYPLTTQERRDYSAKLGAGGLEGAELFAAAAKAEEDGIIEASPFGSMIYRKYENDDRIQLLWVVFLPGATSDDLGMPTASQRDNSLAGMGRPWMMREGPPGAHLMIPITHRRATAPPLRHLGAGQ